MARIRRAKGWPIPLPKDPKGPKGPSTRKGKRVKRARRDMQLRPFQREGVDFLEAHNWRVLIADAPGCGKTPQALVAIAEHPRQLCPALIVVPASVPHNWQHEADQWAPRIRSQVIDTMQTPIEPRCGITITTWDLLAGRQAELEAYGFRLLVCDEAHYAKNEDTQRAMAARAVADGCAHILLLSGTPVLNDVGELRALEALFGEEQPPMLRRLLEDVAPDIPPKKRITVYASIPDDLRAEYTRAAETFSEWLDTYLPQLFDGAQAIEDAAERTMAAEPLAKLSYLRRILGRAKVPAAAVWVRDMVARKQPVVVFGHYTDVLDLLGQALSRLGIPYVRLDGTTSTEARQAAVEAFQAGAVDVFIGSSAAREGITLTRAAHLLRMERDYVPAYEEQAEDRIRRIGQTRPTTIWYLCALDTIDERIAEIVDAKRIIVAESIGSATLEHSTRKALITHWQAIPHLCSIPLVADNPSARIEVPPLPPKEIVQAVVLDPRKWPIDCIQTELRRRGYRQKGIERLPGGQMQIQCRALGAFVDGAVRSVPVAPGLLALVGRRAAGGAARMRATRKVQRLKGVAGRATKAPKR